jgi:hypothetical protein
METIRATGTDTSVIFTLGLQWDVASGVTLGAIFRSPGFHLGDNSVVTSESANVAANTSSAEYFRDDAGTFRYKLPLEAGLGAAYQFGIFELEADLRYHDAVPQYDLYRSDVPFQVLTTSSSGPNVVTTAPPPRVQYAAKRVLNGAVGGRAHIGTVATAHLGFNTAFSPVADSRSSPLRAADLYTFTGGVDFQLGKFGFSLGGGYQFGSSASETSILGGTTVGQSEIGLQTISIHLQHVLVLQRIGDDDDVHLSCTCRRQALVERGETLEVARRAPHVDGPPGEALGRGDGRRSSWSSQVGC